MTAHRSYVSTSILAACCILQLATAFVVKHSLVSSKVTQSPSISQPISEFVANDILKQPVCPGNEDDSKACDESDKNLTSYHPDLEDEVSAQFHRNAISFSEHNPHTESAMDSLSAASSVVPATSAASISLEDCDLNRTIIQVQLHNAKSFPMAYLTPANRTRISVKNELVQKICPDLNASNTTCSSFAWYVLHLLDVAQLTSMRCQAFKNLNSSAPESDHVESLRVRAAELAVAQLGVEHRNAISVTTKFAVPFERRNNSAESLGQPTLCPLEKKTRKRDDHIPQTLKQLKALPSAYTTPEHKDSQFESQFAYTAVLTFYNRPHMIKRMLKALVMQKAPPAEIWITAWNSPHQAEIEEEVMSFKKQYYSNGGKILMKSVYGDLNLKYYGRFQVGLQAGTKYIAFLDDDCVPGRLFFDGALHAINTREYRGLLGSIGSSLPVPLSTWQMSSACPERALPWFCLTSHWYSPTSFVAAEQSDSRGQQESFIMSKSSVSHETDHLGGIWFGETSWLKTIFQETIVTWATAEDFMFCYAVRKYAGVPCFTLPIDIYDTDTWGFPDDYERIANHGGGNRDIPMNYVRQHVHHVLYQRGHERTTSIDMQTIPQIVLFADTIDEAATLSEVVKEMDLAIIHAREKRELHVPNEEALAFQRHYVVTGRESADNVTMLARAFGEEALSLHYLLHSSGWHNLLVGQHTRRDAGSVIGQDYGEVMTSLQQILKSLGPTVFVMAANHRTAGGAGEIDCPQCRLAAALTAQHEGIGILFVENQTEVLQSRRPLDYHERFIRELATWSTTAKGLTGAKQAADIILTAIMFRHLVCDFPEFLRQSRSDSDVMGKNSVLERIARNSTNDQRMPLAPLVQILDNPACLSGRAIVDGKENIFGSASDRKSTTVLLWMFSWHSAGFRNGLVTETRYKRLLHFSSLLSSLQEYNLHWITRFFSNSTLDRRESSRLHQNLGSLAYEIPFFYLSSRIAHWILCLERLVTIQILVQASDSLPFFPFLLADNLNGSNIFASDLPPTTSSIVKDVSERHWKQSLDANKDVKKDSFGKGLSRVYVEDDRGFLQSFPTQYFDIYCITTTLNIGAQGDSLHNSSGLLTLTSQASSAVKPGGFLVLFTRLKIKSAEVHESAHQDAVELFTAELKTYGFQPFSLPSAQTSPERTSWDVISLESAKASLTSVSQDMQYWPHNLSQSDEAGIESIESKRTYLATYMFRRCRT